MEENDGLGQGTNVDSPSPVRSPHMQGASESQSRRDGPDSVKLPAGYLSLGDRGTPPLRSEPHHPIHHPRTGPALSLTIPPQPIEVWVRTP